MKTEHSDYLRHVRDGNVLLNDVIASHLLVEKYLRKVLERELPAPKALLRDQGPSFSVLVRVAEASGLIKADLARVLHSTNRLRNKYAHRMGYSASKVEVDDLLKVLREMDEPFCGSSVPGSERELSLALAGLTGWFQRTYGTLDEG